MVPALRTWLSIVNSNGNLDVDEGRHEGEGGKKDRRPTGQPTGPE